MGIVVAEHAGWLGRATDEILRGDVRHCVSNLTVPHRRQTAEALLVHAVVVLNHNAHLLPVA